MIVVLVGLACSAGQRFEPVFDRAEALRLQQTSHASHEAVDLYSQLLSAWRGRSARDAARAALGLGHSYQQLGLLARSAEALEEALALAHHSTDRLLAARIGSDLGYTLAWVGSQQSTLQEAEGHCQEALTVARELEAVREEALALACLGEVTYVQGVDLERALQIQRDAERLWQQVGDSRGVAQATYAQGYLYSDLRRFDDASEALSRSSTLWESIGDRRGLSITQVAIARLLERRGDLQAALTAYQHVESVLAEVGDAVWLASSLAGQAYIHQYVADVPRALDYFQRALSVAEPSGLEVFSWEMLVALGQVYLTSQDAVESLAQFTAAQRLADALGNPRLQAWALAYEGGAHLARRESALALVSYRKALAALPAAEDHTLEAQAWTGISAAENLHGQLAAALESATRAVAASRAGGDRYRAAQGLLAVGRVATEMRDFTGATKALTAALTDFRTLVGPEHPSVADATIGLANVEFLKGHRRTALSLALEAEAAGLTHLTLTIRHLPERQALAHAARRPRGMDLALSAVDGSTDIARTYDRVILGRGVILDELARRRRQSVFSGDDEVLELRAARARQRFATQLVRSHEGIVSPTELRLSQLEMEQAELQRATRGATRTDFPEPRPGLSAVRSALPPGAALVSFVQFARSSVRGGPGPTASVLGPEFAAFVTRSGDAPPVFVPLGSADRIDTAVANWRHELLPLTSPSLNSAADRAQRIAGERLRALVWDPVTLHLRGASRVFVVPDGSLSVIPFASLPVGMRSFVLDQSPPLHYLTAERDLVSAPLERGMSSGLLAMGGPSFDQSLSPVGPDSDKADSGRSGIRGWASCASIRNLRFEPLEGTEEELRDVTRLWPDFQGDAQALAGAMATETALKREASRFRVLHLATHGFFLDGACLSEPPVAATQTRGVGGLARTAPVENPLRLSGLALAGANRRAQAKPDEDDGILTAEEVAMLDLQGVEWAVLSACDTGIGEIKAGEGVFGLRRAFQVAGARTVIMSLWSVEDQATRAWMRALYEGRFQKKLSTADAVHQASLTVLRDRRARGQSTHPFFWAAFVAAGDWR